MDKIKIAWYGKHFGEEPPLTGNATQGSGTIFFSGCNLHCVFCQNYQISQEALGVFYNINEASEIMLQLQNEGAININLVTPTIWWRQIKDAINLAKEKGLVLPIVWNSNAYDSPAVLTEMEGLIDIYLPDFKYGNGETGVKYSKADNYADVAGKAIKEMVRQVGNLKIDDAGIARRGVIVRHLILPGNVNNSLAVLEKLVAIDPNLHISLMHQYVPLYKSHKYPEIDRLVTKEEFEKIQNYFFELGFNNGWVQKGECQKMFLPDFSKKNPFA